METRLAKFLYSLRIRRGYDRTSDYLRDFNIPISNVYYRDLEAGKKILTVDTAHQLCRALKADEASFFGHYLRDLLPDEISDTVLLPLVDDTFSDIVERQALLERDKEIYREALAQKMAVEATILSDTAVELFIDREELLPVLHFVYAMSQVTKAQLESVLKRNDIDDDVHDVIAMLENLNLVTVEQDINQSDNWIARRITSSSRVPNTERGAELKRVFTFREVRKTLEQQRFSPDWQDGESFCETSIREFSPAKLDQIRGRVMDLLAEGASSGSSSAEQNPPYFVGVFVGLRSEYAPERNTEDITEK